MSKEQVMDYVMNSPANTNPNVLSGMLDAISGTQLPSPTESDNGKVLGVDGGEYKLVDGTNMEVIKLGEVGVMQTFEARTPAWFNVGISADKSFSEVVGNKTIVNIVATLSEWSGEVVSSGAWDVHATLSKAGTGELITNQPSSLDTKNLLVTGVITLQDAHGSTPPVKLTLCAICI